MKFLNNVIMNSDATEDEIRKAISGINDVNDVIEVPYSEYNYLEEDTLLHLASKYSNIRAVKMLLEEGANPNIAAQDNIPPLWEMQYDGEDSEENDKRLAIAKMLLDYDADPYIVVDHEKLMHHVDFEVFEENYSGKEHICRFYLYLLAYDYMNSIPMKNKIDKEDLEKYRIEITKSDGRKRLHIYDENGLDIVDNSKRI